MFQKRTASSPPLCSLLVLHGIPTTDNDDETLGRSQMRSSLNMTGLSPSMQQLIATPFSLYHGKFPPYPKSRTLLYIETQAELQKPSGMFMPSTMNSWPSLKTPHSFIGATGVTGLFAKTSPGLNRLNTVIRTLWSFINHIHRMDY